MKIAHKISASVIIGMSVLFAQTASAASFFFVPATGTIGVGAKVTVDLKIDSEGVGMNAAQATIRFPKETLEVTSINKEDSSLNFWLTEPTFSNTEGTITFAGGTPYGISGASMQVLHITFTTKGSGSAPITITEAAITASDGSGTNILAKTGGATLTVSTTPVVQPSTTTPVVVPTPEQIVRPVTTANDLPKKPTLTVPLYPDTTSWYNAQDIFTARWDLPLDIAGVSAVMNKEPNYKGGKSEGLFDSKMFGALTDGIWYLHIQFKNNVGWGPVAHYHIAVDTKSPLPFEITSMESEVSDNPTPIFSFKSNDALSGLKEYWVRVDNQDWATINAQDYDGSHKLANQAPGKHHITVRAIDNAGNGIESSVDFEVLPLPLPTFSFVTSKLYSDEAAGLSIRGTAIPKSQVLLLIKKGNVDIQSTTIPVDESGKWETVSSQVLLSGTYSVSIQNKDARGALSNIVTSENIKVVGRYTNIISIIIFLLSLAIVGGIFFFREHRKRTNLRIEMAERDTANVFRMIESDIQKLEDAQKTPTPVDDEFITAKIKKNVAKMGGYIRDEISRARK